MLKTVMCFRCENGILPEIIRNLSSKSVREVLDILYSRYPE